MTMNPEGPTLIREPLGYTDVYLQLLALSRLPHMREHMAT